KMLIYSKLIRSYFNQPIKGFKLKDSKELEGVKIIVDPVLLKSENSSVKHILIGLSVKTDSLEDSYIRGKIHDICMGYEKSLIEMFENNGVIGVAEHRIKMLIVFHQESAPIVKIPMWEFADVEFFSRVYNSIGSFFDYKLSVKFSPILYNHQSMAMALDVAVSKDHDVDFYIDCVLRNFLEDFVEGLK
ncbi:hypothetical protein, partial [Geobacillus stearothermophilus]|uniref:hypothetical protein n=1 Tax=Geobacillus stearothermophilus TaxID=1422 RepID=UPI002E1EC49D|nr:hypothetical protein [Geobacillus stearothermophilus]